MLLNLSQDFRDKLVDKLGEVLYWERKSLMCKGNLQSARSTGSLPGRLDSGMPTEDIPRTWRLNLPDQGVSLPAAADHSLRQTLLRAGVAWPASCRNGSCRACIGHLASGSVRYGVDWPGLLPEEKVGGAVLPCVAYPTSDVSLTGPRD